MRFASNLDNFSILNSFFFEINRNKTEAIYIQCYEMKIKQTQNKQLNEINRKNTAKLSNSN